MAVKGGLTQSTLFVNEVQRGNPILQFVKNVKWEYSKEVVPDYVMAQTCAVFVSVKYHYRHPKVYFVCLKEINESELVLQYITKRIQEVGRNFRLRVLLVLVDDETNLPALQDLNKIAFASDFTLILAWSNMECARYVETFKSYESKSSSSIQEKEETEYLPRVIKVLGSVRSINKTDVITLLDVFGSFANVCQANEQQLVLCPGIGEKKVKRLHQALHIPFIKKAKTTSTSELVAGDSVSLLHNSSGSNNIKSNSNSISDGVQALTGIHNVDGIYACDDQVNNDSSNGSGRSKAVKSSSSSVKAKAAVVDLS